MLGAALVALALVAPAVATADDDDGWRGRDRDRYDDDDDDRDRWRHDHDRDRHRDDWRHDRGRHKGWYKHGRGHGYDRHRRFDVPPHIAHYRDYDRWYHGRVYHRAHRHYHPVYAFPAYGPRGPYYEPTAYCEGNYFARGGFYYDGPRLGIRWF